MIARLAALTLAELSLGVALTPSSSSTAKHGIAASMEARIGAKRTAMDAATESVLLADADRFGHFAKYHVARLHEFDEIVTDGSLAGKDTAAVREMVSRVDVA